MQQDRKPSKTGEPEDRKQSKSSEQEGQQRSQMGGQRDQRRGETSDQRDRNQGKFDQQQDPQHSKTSEPEGEKHSKTSALAQYLKGCEYPCRGSDIERHAKRNGAPENVLADIRELPSRQFNSEAEVRQKLTQATAPVQ